MPPDQPTGDSYQPPWQPSHTIGQLQIRTRFDGDEVVTLRRAGQQVDIPAAEWAEFCQMITGGAL